MPEAAPEPGKTLVLGERELAIGFRLIGFQNVVEVTDESAVAEFQRAISDGQYSLVIASQSIRPRLSEAQRGHADSTLRPLVVFVPTPSGEFEVESINDLAKRILGVTLAVPN
ncbi:MAG: V-type ATP synthase subunit F [Thermoplasmata archaeon]